MLLEIDCDRPYISSCLEGEGKKELRVDKKTHICPPHFVCFVKKRVSFSKVCDVFQYKLDLSAEEKAALWYDDNEMDDIRISTTGQWDSEMSMGSDDNTSDHTMRVLRNYQSYRSVIKGSDHLRHISRKSSKQARDNARKRALDLSKATNTHTVPRAGFFGFGPDPRLTDFYLETFLDMLVDRSGWICGGLLDIREDAE